MYGYIINIYIHSSTHLFTCRVSDTFMKVPFLNIKERSFLKIVRWIGFFVCLFFSFKKSLKTNSFLKKNKKLLSFQWWPQEDSRVGKRKKGRERETKAEKLSTCSIGYLFNYSGDVIKKLTGVLTYQADQLQSLRNSQTLRLQITINNCVTHSKNWYLNFLYLILFSSEQ